MSLVKSWRQLALATLIVSALVGAWGAWGAWSKCWFGLLCEDGVVAVEREFGEYLAKQRAAESAWRVEHPDQEFVDRDSVLSVARLPTVRGLVGSSVLLENGRLLSPEEVLGLRMGLNANLPGPRLRATAVALVASPRSEKQQDILWSDGRLTRNQHFDGRTGLPSPGRWTEEQPDSVHIDDGVALVSGGNFRLVLRRDGTVWGYGSNEHGQLGTSEENRNDQWLPLTQPVAGLKGVTAIAAGARYALALKSDGTVWQWGANHTAVGMDDMSGAWDGRPRARRTAFFAPEPWQVPGLVDIVKIAAGRSHSVALDKHGVVWAWGNSAGGHLGVPPRFSSDVLGYDGSVRFLKGSFVEEPVRVPFVEEVVDIAAAGYHTLALKRDGTAWGWGWNSSGQLGVRAYMSWRPSAGADPVRVGRESLRPFPIIGMRNTQRIYTSANGSALLDDKGDLFVLGSQFGAYDFAARVPGRAGKKTRMQFSLNLSGIGATLDSEVGLYVVDDRFGHVGGLLPGDEGYAAAALAPGRVVPVFEPGHQYGGLPTRLETWLKLDADRLVGFYTIFKSDRSTWLRENPKNRNEERTQAFFSFPAANPDGLDHGHLRRGPLQSLGYEWERSTAGQSHQEVRDMPYVLSGHGLAGFGMDKK